MQQGPPVRVWAKPEPQEMALEQRAQLGPALEQRARPEQVLEIQEPRELT